MSNGSNAKKSMGQIISFNPTSEYYYSKGLNAYHQQKMNKAVRYLERAMQIDPLDEMVACQLGIIYSELGDFQQSNDIFMRILKEMDSEMYECNYFLANNFAHMGMFKEASNYAQSYLAKESNGEFAEDILDLLDIIEFENEVDLENPYQEEDLIYKNEQSRKHLECGEFVQAIEVLNKTIEQYPKYWSAYNNLALAYFHIGEIGKALDILDRISKENPGNLHALCNRLVFAFYQNDYKTIIELKLMLKKVNPINLEHQFKLGATFALVGEYEASYYWLKRLIRFGYEGDGTFYYWYSYAAYFTSHENEAKAAWERAIQLAPDKIGLEPWNDSKLTAEGFENHTTAMMQKLSNEFMEERLVALYLLSKSEDKEKLFASKEIKKNPLFTHLEREYVKYLKNPQDSTSEFVQFLHETADIIYREHHPVGIHEINLFYLWFSSAIELTTFEKVTLNAKAWAAAVIYLWYKLRSNMRTLKDVAQNYEVSPATLSKYVKILEEILS